MSNIETNLAKIKSAIYGEEVRDAIHDAIHDCYEDGKAGEVDLIARENSEEAIGTANNAVTTANNAVTTANNAVTTANNANSRVNNIIAQSGTSDTEVVDSRQDADGNTYSVLKNRLDMENTVLQSILQSVNDIKVLKWTNGFCYDLRYNTIDISNPTVAANYAIASDEYEPGDIYLYWGEGTSTARSYAGIDDLGNVIYVLSSSASQTLRSADPIWFYALVGDGRANNITKVIFNSKKAVNHNVVKINEKKQIPLNSDLNDYMNQGTFFSNSAAVSNTLVNKPDRINSGFLLIIKQLSLSSSTIVVQFLMPNTINFNIYYRIHTTEWSEWFRVAKDKDIENLLNVVDLAKIQNNSDLNNYITPGSYACTDASICTSLVNQPLLDPSGFSLYVLRTNLASYGDDYIRQILFPNKAGISSMYTRVKTTEWSNWEYLMPASITNGVYITAESTFMPVENVTHIGGFRLRIATNNVAHYWMQGGSYGIDYLSEHPLIIPKWREWLLNSDIDILFLQECEDYIDANRSMSAFDYLYKGLFDQDTNIDTAGTGTTSPTRRKILNRLGKDTNSQMRTVQTLTPESYNKNGYYNYVICNIGTIGEVLLINIHNFAGNDNNRIADRKHYLDDVKYFIESQNYDYFILAGDFNAATDEDRSNILDFCEAIDGVPVNGGILGWFKTIYTEVLGVYAYDNIIVSSNITIINIKCDASLTLTHKIHTDHNPVIAEIRFT